MAGEKYFVRVFQSSEIDSYTSHTLSELAGQAGSGKKQASNLRRGIILYAFSEENEASRFAEDSQRMFPDLSVILTQPERFE